MPKKTKIKRYGKIYSKRRARPWKAIVAVLVLAALFFVGWSLYQPIMNFLSGDLALPESSESGSEPDSLPEQSSDISLPEPEPEPDPVSFRAVYLPASALSDRAALEQLLETAKSSGINAVMIDLKDEAGQIWYQSSVEQAVSAGAVSVSAVDLRELVEYLGELDIAVVGRLCAFRDPIAANAHQDMSVRYIDPEFLWLDDSAANGGKPWLNPYSEEACGYLSALAEEAAAMGISAIALDSVRFPGALGIEFAYFGAEAEAVGRSEALARFMADIRSSVGDLPCLLMAETGTSVGGDTYVYDGNPAALTDGIFSPRLFPSEITRLGLDAAIGTETSALDPYGSVKQQLEILSPLTKTENLAPVLQAYDCDANFISEQIRAAEDAGLEQYILYNPDGNYPFG